MPTNILLVEDTPGIRDALAQILRQEGYQVATARDGEEALRLLRAGTPVSVILFDLFMPNLDGSGLIAELKKNPQWAAIPTVLMSADSAILAKESKYGVDAYLDKPIKLDALFSVLSRFRADQ